jgi:peptidoglycan/LPS O-acetylase OafA/YrhL
MRRQTVLSALADLTAVVLFVVLGRTSHDEGTWLGGVAATAAPFLVGTVVGWLVVLARRRSPQAVRSGLMVLGSTVVVGMVVRHLATGRAIPASFVVVATLVLALLMLGWRAVSARAGAAVSRPPR